MAVRVGLYIHDMGVTAAMYRPLDGGLLLGFGSLLSLC